MSANIFQHIIFPGRGNAVRIERSGNRIKITVNNVIGTERVVIEVDVSDADLVLKGLR